MKIKSILVIFTIGCALSFTQAQIWNSCGVSKPASSADCLAYSNSEKLCCYAKLNTEAGCFEYANNSTYINLGGELSHGLEYAQIDCGTIAGNKDQFFGINYCGKGKLAQNSNDCYNGASSRFPCCLLNTTFDVGVLKSKPLTACVQTTTDFVYTAIGRSLFSNATGILNCSDTTYIDSLDLNSSGKFVDLKYFLLVVIIAFIF